MSGWAQRVADHLVADDGSHDPREVTASGIGSCLRQSAWRLAGVPFTDDVVRHPSAVIGRAIHRELTESLAAAYGAVEDVDGGGWETDAVMIERAVPYIYRGRRFGGRLDAYAKRGNGATGSGELVDFKTCGDFAWSRAQAGTIPYGHIMQALLYGAALEAEGWVVTAVRWVYVHRGSGAVHELAVAWEGAAMREALHQRLDQILDADRQARAVRPEAVETEGEGITARGFSECNGCPFRSRCWSRGDDWEPIGPDHEQAERIAAVASDYAGAREAEKAAAARKAAAAAKLRHAGVRGQFGSWTVDATGRSLQVRATIGGSPE